MSGMQINFKQLREDPNKKGWVAIFDETDAELSSEQQLSQKRGGIGQDVSAATGFLKFTAGEASFEDVNSLKPNWLPDTIYSSDDIVQYRKLFFRCQTEHTSGVSFADDLIYWECLSDNGIIDYKANHGFQLYQPIYKHILPSTTHVVQFTTTGTTTWTVPDGVARVDVLLQGGGSGGSHGWTNNVDNIFGGSGGAAGVQRYYSNYKVTPGAEITVVVPSGGAGGYGTDNTAGTNPTNGGTAWFGDLNATGGIAPNNNYDSGGDNADYTAGSVSGGTQAGGAGSGGTNNAQNGGAGKYNSITGTNVCRGGGGAGSSRIGHPSGVGGVGGGGNPGVAGAANTGSGGGGKHKGTGGAGGSGVVIVRYQFTDTTWELSRSDENSTLASHVVIEKTVDLFLAVNAGMFECIDHQQGHPGEIKYTSDSTAGTVVDSPDQNIINPAFKIIDTNTLEVLTSGYLLNMPERRFNDWQLGRLYFVNSVVSYRGLVLRCHTGHTSNTGTVYSLGDDMQYWSISNSDGVIFNKPNHGFSLLTPVCETDTTWISAVADSTLTTLATHVVIDVGVNWFLAVKSGVYNIPMHGKTPGLYYCSESSAGQVTETPTNIWNPVYSVKNTNNIEIVVDQPVEDRTDVTNIDDGYKLIYSKVKSESTELSVSIPYDGEKYPNMRIIYKTKGFLPGGNNTLGLFGRIQFNGDSNSANYRSEYQRLYPSTDATGIPNNSPYYYASSKGIYLNAQSTGGYGLAIGDFNLKSGMNRIGFTQEFTKRASGTATRYLSHYGHEWINSAAPITSVEIIIDQFADAEIYIYGRP